MRFGAIGPVGLDRIPELLESLLIGVAVLHDKRRDALGMPERQTKTDRCAIILHVQRVASTPSWFDRPSISSAKRAKLYLNS